MQIRINNCCECPRCSTCNICLDECGRGTHKDIFDKIVDFIEKIFS